MLATTIFQGLAGDLATPNFVEAAAQTTITQSGGSSVQTTTVLQFARLSGPGTDTPIDVLQATSFSAFLTDWFAISTDQMSMTSLRARFLDNPVSPYVPLASAAVGGIATDRMPTQTTVNFQKVGYGRGRSYNGRTGLPGIVEADTIGNRLSGGGVTNWTNVLNDLLALRSFTGLNDTWGMVVVSRTLSTLTTSPTSFWGSRVSDVILHNVLGTQNRRKEGRGV